MRYYCYFFVKFLEKTLQIPKDYGKLGISVMIKK